jgi:hypothetical protein
MAGCPQAAEMRRLVARRESDELTPAEAPLLSRHLLSCPACSAESVRRDPTLLFASLSVSASSSPASPASASADDLEARSLATATLAAIGRNERVRLRSSPRRPVLKAASVALLAGALLAFLLGKDVAKDRDASAKKEPAPSPIVPALLQPIRAEVSASRPLIEEIRNPGARVYQFAAASPKEPNVVFVANPGADL